MQIVLYFVVLLYLLCAPAAHAITSDEIDKLLTPTVEIQQGFVMKNGSFMLRLLPNADTNSTPEAELDADLLSIDQQRIFQRDHYVVIRTIPQENILTIQSPEIDLGSISGKVQRHDSRSILRESTDVSSILAVRTENGLISDSGELIMPTRCDDTSVACVAGSPADWTQLTSYGWGIAFSQSDESVLLYQPLSSEKEAPFIHYAPLSKKADFHINIFTAPDTSESTYHASIITYLIPL